MGLCLGCGNELTTGDPANGIFCRNCSDKQSQQLSGWTCPSCGVNYSPFVTQCECSKLLRIDINPHGTTPCDSPAVRLPLPQVDPDELCWSSNKPGGNGGFYVIWDEGHHGGDLSDARVAVIYQDRAGKQFVVFPNWVSGPTPLDELENVALWARIPTEIRTDEDDEDDILAAMK